jgi:hypothetical protein
MINFRDLGIMEVVGLFLLPLGADSIIAQVAEQLL